MNAKFFPPAMILCTALIALSPKSANGEPLNGSAGVAVTASVTATKPALSTGLDEIVKLSKAGIDDSVILVYIRNSSTAYTPNAEDLIRLREEGVSTTVTAALMQRGDELRKAAAVAWNQPAQTAPAQVQQQPQQPTIVAGPAYATPASTVTVIGYPRSYYYGYPSSYYGYNYYYPSRSYYYPRYGYSGYYSYPRFSVGVNLGGFHFGGYRGGHGGYYGGHHSGGHYGGGHHRGGIAIRH
jgi:hypothetical protein